MSKNNFILYKDFKTTIDILTDEQAGKLIKAVFSYVNGRVEPTFNDSAITIAFSVLKTQLERDLIKYKNIVERNQTNGLNGGRPRKEKNPKENDKHKKPNGLIKTQEKTQKPKKADSDSDSVRDSDNDSNINKEIVEEKSDKSIAKTHFGEFNNVLLSDEELKKLKDKTNEWDTYIEKLSSYIASKGKRYKSHYATILSWLRKDEKEKPKEEEPKRKLGTWV